MALQFFVEAITMSTNRLLPQKKNVKKTANKKRKGGGALREEKKTEKFSMWYIHSPFITPNKKDERL